MKPAVARILVDCGMIQGSRDVEEDNAAAFGFEPGAIDIVLLTHAHLEHCGRLPPLVKRGFCGEIIATAATRDLARLVLLDAAHLQEEDARRRQRRAYRRGKDDVEEPLYTLLDVFDKTFLVHGEEAAMSVLAGKLSGSIEMPYQHQVYAF